MSTYLSRTICALILAQALFFGNTLFAQFLVPTNGPEGGYVSGITELNNGSLYAYMSGIGIVESDDSGLSWNPIVQQPDDYFSIMISDRDNRLYGVTDQGVVLRLDSLDGEWLETGELPVHASHLGWVITKLIVDSSNRLFASVYSWESESGEIHLSDNHGETWQRLEGTPLDSTCLTIYDLAIDYSGQLWVVGLESPFAINRVYKLSPDLTAWTEYQVTDEYSNYLWNIVADENCCVYLNAGRDCFRYNETAGQWTELTPAVGDYLHVLIATPPGSLISDQQDGTYESSDHGDSWSLIGDHVPVYPVGATIASDNSLFGWSNYSGIEKFSRTSQEWSLANNGFVATRIEKLIGGGDAVYANTNDLSFRTADQGGSWMHVFNDKKLLTRIAGNPSALFSWNLDFLIRSIDEGETWEQVLSGNVKAMVKSAQGSLFAGGDSLWKSSDMGTTWSPVPNANQFIEYPFLIQSIVVSGEAVLAFVTDGMFPRQLIRSLDDGLTWESLPEVLDFSLRELISDNNGHLFYYENYFGEFFYRSDDLGETWIVLDGLPVTGDSNGPTALYPASGERLFAQYWSYSSNDDNGALFESYDYGESWTRIPGIYPRINVFAEDAEGYLYAGTDGSGVYISSEPILSVWDATKPLPTEFTLYQNYPNPFNSTTTFVFDLPLTGPVTMQVFDITGRLAATPLTGTMTVGHHSFNWDANSLASGIYFYRLQTDHNIQTRKLTLIK